MIAQLPHSRLPPATLAETRLAVAPDVDGSSPVVAQQRTLDPGPLGSYSCRDLKDADGALVKTFAPVADGEERDRWAGPALPMATGNFPIKVNNRLANLLSMSERGGRAARERGVCGVRDHGGAIGVGEICGEWGGVDFWRSETGELGGRGRFGRREDDLANRIHRILRVMKSNA